MAKGGALSSYAQTRVSPGQSHEAIEKLLGRIGVDAFRWTSLIDREGIEFNWPRPDGTPIGFRLVIRFDTAARRAQMLRALFWYLKAKIEAIEFGLLDMEQAFLPHMLTPGGRTVFERVQQGDMEALIGPDMIALPEGREG
jgi:hypothetical protein